MLASTYTGSYMSFYINFYKTSLGNLDNIYGRGFIKVNIKDNVSLRVHRSAGRQGFLACHADVHLSIRPSVNILSFVSILT